MMNKNLKIKNLIKESFQHIQLLRYIYHPDFHNGQPYYYILKEVHEKMLQLKYYFFEMESQIQNLIEVLEGDRVEDIDYWIMVKNHADGFYYTAHRLYKFVQLKGKKIGFNRFKPMGIILSRNNYLEHPKNIYSHNKSFGVREGPLFGYQIIAQLKGGTWVNKMD